VISSIKNKIIKVSDSDNETNSKLVRNQKEIYAEDQMRYLWSLNHEPDIDQIVVFEGYRRTQK
jgi:hypothetical protein